MEEGVGNVWLPVFISHVFILPGVFGWVIVVIFGGKIPFSDLMGLYYFFWGIVSLVACFMLPRTKPFVSLKIDGNNSRYMALIGLMIFPVALNIVLGYIALINSNI